MLTDPGRTAASSASARVGGCVASPCRAAGDARASGASTAVAGISGHDVSVVPGRAIAHSQSADHTIGARLGSIACSRAAESSCAAGATISTDAERAAGSRAARGRVADTCGAFELTPAHGQQVSERGVSTIGGLAQIGCSLSASACADDYAGRAADTANLEAHRSTGASAVAVVSPTGSTLPAANGQYEYLAAVGQQLG